MTSHGNVLIKTKQEQQMQIDVVDFTGKIVLSTSKQVYGLEAVYFDTFSWRLGVYFVRVRNEKSEAVKKLVVL